MTEIYDYQHEVARQQSEAARREQEKKNRETFHLLLDHYDLSNTEANFQILVSWANGDLTVERFQAFLDAGQGSDLDWGGTNAKIIEEIRGLLDAKGDRHAFDNERAVASMRFWPRARLRARLAELKFRAGKTLADAQTLLSQHREAQRGKWHPFETMPDAITPEMVRDALNTSAGRNKWRQWNARYGHAQVENRRLS
jgi:hypothetical protein